MVSDSSRDHATQGLKLPSQSGVVTRNSGVLSLHAFAKINLFLHVGRRQKNGRHCLNALNVFASLKDTLSYRPLSGRYLTQSLHISGLNPRIVAKDQSTMQKAFNVFAHHHHFQDASQEPLMGHLRITKRIPARAGLGGGSSDAAVMLSLLSRAYHHPLTQEIIGDCAKVAGSDLHTCMPACANFVAETGEKIKVLPTRIAQTLFSRIGIVIVSPRLPCQGSDTARIFHDFDRMFRPTSRLSGFSAHLPRNRRQFFRNLQCKHRNDLTHVASRHIPVLTSILPLLDALLPQHLLLARMSGSGSSCYALFPSYAIAALAKRQLMGNPLVKKQLSVFVGSLV